MTTLNLATFIARMLVIAIWEQRMRKSFDLFDFGALDAYKVLGAATADTSDGYWHPYEDAKWQFK